MGWLAAGVVAVEVLLWFWVPGAAVAFACRVRGLALLAVAPLLTLGMFGVTAILVDLVGWRWSAWTALPPVAALTLVAAGWHRHRTAGTAGALRIPVHQPRHGRRWLAAAIAAGVAAQLVPVAIGMGLPTRLLTAHDAIAHFEMLAYARDPGIASSLSISGSSQLDHVANGFYGAAWHATAALVDGWPDASTVFNVAFLLPCALAWTLGLTYLAQATFASRPRVWRWAAILSAAGVALPLTLAMRPEGMIANGMGVALVPAMLALVSSWASLVRGTRCLVVGACLVGVGLTHPNALISCALVLTPWFVPRARAALRRRPWTARRRVALLVSTLAVLAAGTAVAVSGRMHAVVAVAPEPPLAWWEAIIRILSGDLTGMGWGSGFLVVCAAALGAALAWRLPAARWLVWANVIIVGMYLLATSPIPVLNDVDRPWYGEPRRFASVVVAVLIPLAALAIDSLPSWAVATGRLRTSAPRRVVAATIGLLVVCLSTAPATIGAAALARASYLGSDASPPVATDAELAMMRRLGSEIDPRRAILGSAFSGAAHLHGLNGQDVMPLTYLTEENDDLRYVRTHIDELGSDPVLCQALGRLDVHYLYVDPDAWDVVANHISLLHAPAHGIRLVDSGGSASVYEIDAC